MLYHPDIIMCLWFFPFTVWILIPLALGTIGLSFKLVNQVLFINNAQPQALQSSNRRQNSRFDTAPLTVQVSDGRRSAQATISNISHCGLCLKNLPEKILKTAEKLTVTLTEQGAELRTLRVQPIWVHAGDTGLVIGSAVQQPTAQWREFVRKHQ